MCKHCGSRIDLMDGISIRLTEVGSLLKMLSVYIEDDNFEKSTMANALGMSVEKILEIEEAALAALKD